MRSSGPNDSSVLFVGWQLDGAFPVGNVAVVEDRADESDDLKDSKQDQRDLSEFLSLALPSKNRSEELTKI